jgi:signal transduction histidine kinase
MENNQNELIRRISSVVGHELRNPLAVIGNSAYFVKTKLGAAKEKDAKVEKHLGIIASEIARADHLIADMLVYSRPVELKISAVSLASVIEQALADCSLGEVKIKRSAPKGEVMIQADAKVLADALRRLLDNAVDAMGGRGEVAVTFGSGAQGPFVEVRDAGPGIKPEDLPRVMDPFFTTKPRGLGLGLAMAAKAAAAHGGKVVVKNSAGGGVLAALSLPRHDRGIPGFAARSACRRHVGR